MVCAAFLEMNAGNSATISPRTDQVHPSEDAQWLVRNTNRPFKTPRNLISEGPVKAGRCLSPAVERSQSIPIALGRSPASITRAIPVGRREPLSRQALFRISRTPGNFSKCASQLSRSAPYSIAVAYTTASAAASLYWRCRSAACRAMRVSSGATMHCCVKAIT